MTIRNPVEWGYDSVRTTMHGLNVAAHGWHRSKDALDDPIPTVRRIAVSDLADVLKKGFEDFAASRTDLIFIAVIYPLAGLFLARLTIGTDMLPLLFPLVSGFALLGPFAAAGLYEMSRRRELGQEVSWADAMGVFYRPSFGAVVMLGLVLTGIFLLWLASAMTIYWATFGLETPNSLPLFLSEVFGTTHGWVLMIAGVGVGFLFALLVLVTSVVSFPLLLDRKVSVWAAIMTSVHAVAANPVPMLLWGLIVAGGLVLGSIPLLLGLIVVMPVLGHATWHLYRKVVQ